MIRINQPSTSGSSVFNKHGGKRNRGPNIDPVELARADSAMRKYNARRWNAAKQSQYISFIDMHISDHSKAEQYAMRGVKSFDNGLNSSSWIEDAFFSRYTNLDSNDAARVIRGGISQASFEPEKTIEDFLTKRR